MVTTQDGTTIQPDGQSFPYATKWDRFYDEADTFAELWPEHVGIGLDAALTFGIPALGLTAADVRDQIESAINEKDMWV